jgi:hypothetical protein
MEQVLNPWKDEVIFTIFFRREDDSSSINGNVPTSWSTSWSTFRPFYRY